MTDPRIPSELQGYGGSGAADSTTPTVDPLGWCVIATTALLTWLIGPVALTALAAIGFVKYWRAWRSGRADSNCLLGDVRLVLVYLAVLTAVGATATAVRFL